MTVLPLNLWVSSSLQHPTIKCVLGILLKYDRAQRYQSEGQTPWHATKLLENRRSVQGKRVHCKGQSKRTWSPDWKLTASLLAQEPWRGRCETYQKLCVGLQGHCQILSLLEEKWKKALTCLYLFGQWAVGELRRLYARAFKVGPDAGHTAKCKAAKEYRTLQRSIRGRAATHRHIRAAVVR